MYCRQICAFVFGLKCVMLISQFSLRLCSSEQAHRRETFLYFETHTLPTACRKRPDAVLLCIPCCSAAQAHLPRFTPEKRLSSQRKVCLIHPQCLCLRFFAPSQPFQTLYSTNTRPRCQTHLATQIRPLYVDACFSAGMRSLRNVYFLLSILRSKASLCLRTNIYTSEGLEAF